MVFHYRESFVEAWMDALATASASLHTSLSSDPADLDVSAAALESMAKYLLQKKRRWDLAPDGPPPDSSVPSALSSASSSSEGGGWAQIDTTAVMQSLGNNRFACFQDYSSDDEEEETNQEVESVNAVEERMHTPFVRRSAREPKTIADVSPPTLPPAMDMRRIYIRVLDAKASVALRRAIIYRHSHQWKEGAEQFASALQLILQAIFYADEAISKLLSRRSSLPLVTPLMEDANIAHVAVQYMAKGRHEFLAAAQRQAAYLRAKLEPQWARRDEIKARMGDRWYSNAKPKKDFSSLRKEQERELREVESALKMAEDLDIEHAESNALMLQEKVSAPALEKERYNGRRPEDTSNRVSWEEYPDAQEFGWTFTGSSGVTEFFEKDEVKLDWYFTTATVKTSLDHPRQGRTQLFAERVDPETYIKILLNPRAHTGQRYQRRRGRRRRQGERDKNPS